MDLGKLEPVVGFALGIGTIVLAHFMPDVRSELLVAGGALLTAGSPALSNVLRPRPNGPEGGGRSLLPALALVLLLVTTASCAAVKSAGKQVVADLRDCVAANDENRAVKDAAIECLVDVAASDPSDCLSGLPVGIAWCDDELECLLSRAAVSVREVQAKK